MRPPSRVTNSSTVWRSPAGSAALAVFSVSARSRAPEMTWAFWARPSTSRIKATLPSPMMVAPEKALMPLSCFCSGLTTISSVSWMASTTSPNWRSSAWSTTMLIDAVVLRRTDLDLELAAQVDQGQQVAAQPVDRRPVDLLDAALGLLAFEPDQLQQADLGNRVAVAADGDGQGRDDGQRQRDLHLDGGAPPGPALDVHRAADLLDVGPHHVHADAPAGEVRHPVRRREPGQEDQVDELALARAGRPARE